MRKITLTLALSTIGCAYLNRQKPAAPAELSEARPPAKERKVHASGGMELYTRQTGQGPLVLVVNGGPGSSSDIIAPDLEAYEEDVRWLYYDQRGTGRSAMPASPGAFALEPQVDDIEAIRTTYGIEKLDVLASGFGATFAVAYASKNPDRVGRLMLLNPITSAGQMKKAEELRASRLTPDDTKAFADLEKSGLKKAAPERYREQKIALALRIGTCKREGPQPKGRSEDHRQATAAVLKNLGEYDLVPLAPKIAAKTAIIMGRCGFLPVTSVEEMAVKLKNVEMVVFEDAGAYPYVEDKERFRKALKAFFGGGPAPSAAPGTSAKTEETPPKSQD